MMRRLGFTLKSSQTRLSTIITEESSKPAKVSTLFARSKMRWLSSETWQGALILAALLVCFFSTPLSRLPDSHYSVADILQVYTLARVNVPLPGLSNTLLSDTFQANQPWTFFNRDSIWAGQLPLWNPYNANGVPHFANYQSAVLSVYSWPFYVMPFRIGLVVSAFMKLFGLGFFTFLYLKQIKLSQIPALLGGTAFMFGGYHIVYLNFTVTGTSVVLPACLYFAERVIQKLEDNPAASYRRELVGLSLSLTVGVLAGHPETFYYGLILVAVYILFRLLNFWYKKGYSRTALWQTLKSGMQFGLAGIAGAALAAVQLLPFAEYLSLSAEFSQRSGAGHPKLVFPPNLWPVEFFPNLVGNNTLPYKEFLPFGFSITDPQYLGGLVVFLAGLALVFCYRDKYLRFFGLAALLWIVYAYDLLGLQHWFQALPGMSLGLVYRSSDIWLFSVSCCAALLLHRVLHSNLAQTSKLRFLRIGLVVGSGLAFLVIALLGAKQLIVDSLSQLRAQEKAFLDYIPGHIWTMGLTFGLGLVSLLAIWFVPRNWLKTGAGVVLLLLVFFQSGFILKDYNPTISDAFFFPISPAMQQFKQAVGENRVLSLTGNDDLPPNVNVLYKYGTIRLYDSLGIPNYKTLSTIAFGPAGDQASEKALQLFGIKYLMISDKILNLDPGLQSSDSGGAIIGEILPNQEVSQSFKVDASGLTSIQVKPYDYKRTNRCTLQLRLEDLTSGQPLQERSIACASVSTNTGLNLSFTPLPDSARHQYRLVISSPDATPGNALGLLTRPDLKLEEGKLTRGNTVENGTLDLDYKVLPDLKKVGQAGPYPIYQYNNSLGQYYSVSKAVTATSEQEALKLVTSPDFDPYSAVVLDKAAVSKQDSGQSEKGIAARVLEEQPEKVKLEAQRDTPGYLVLTSTYYPGWKARVNGKEMPVLKANYAFSAVELPAGKSEIEYYYDPVSLKLGLIITAITFLSGLLVLFGRSTLNRFKNRIRRA